MSKLFVVNTFLVLTYMSINILSPYVTKVLYTFLFSSVLRHFTKKFILRFQHSLKLIRKTPIKELHCAYFQTFPMLIFYSILFFCKLGFLQKCTIFLIKTLRFYSSLTFTVRKKEVQGFPLHAWPHTCVAFLVADIRD